MAILYEQTKDEIILPEIPKLHSFERLFEPTEYTKPEHIDLLNDAKKEIIELFHRPLRSAHNTLAPDSRAIMEEDVIQSHVEALQKATDALSFLDSMCENWAHSQYENSPINIDVESDNHQGIKIRAKRSDGKKLGTCLNDDIYTMEIVIRKAAEASYTPMQLNFRLLQRHNEESSSIRSDLHKRHDSNEVQLDFEVARHINRKHQKIESLSSNDREETEKRFGALLAAFEINLVENNILGNKNVQIGDPTDRHQTSKKRLLESVDRSKQLIELTPNEIKQIEEEARLAREQAEEDRLKSEEVKMLVNRAKETVNSMVSADTIDILAKCLDESSENSLDTALAWVLGTTDINKINLETLKTRIEDLDQYLNENIDKGEETLLWPADKYSPEIKRLSDLAEDQIIATENQKVLDDFKILISFMQFYPVE